MNDVRAITFPRPNSVKTFLLLVPLLALAGGRLTAEPQPLTIDYGHSQVQVAVKATVDSFVAQLDHYDAQLVVDSGGSEVQSATFRFKFADVKTGKTARDRQMNEWEGSERFPDGEFVLATLTPRPDGRFTARGQLRFHGTTREIEFPIDVTSDGRIFAIDGEAALDTRDFGLPVIRKFAILKVDPLVTVRFHLQGTR